MDKQEQYKERERLFIHVFYRYFHLRRHRLIIDFVIYLALKNYWDTSCSSPCVERLFLSMVKWELCSKASQKVVMTWWASTSSASSKLKLTTVLPLVTPVTSTSIRPASICWSTSRGRDFCTCNKNKMYVGMGRWNNYIPGCVHCSEMSVVLPALEGSSRKLTFCFATFSSQSS